MTISPTETLYTSIEAAFRLGLKPDTVRKLVQRNLLHPHKTIGRSYLFRQSELDRYSKEKNPQGNPHFVRKQRVKRSA